MPIILWLGFLEILRTLIYYLPSPKLFPTLVEKMLVLINIQLNKAKSDTILWYIETIGLLSKDCNKLGLSLCAWIYFNVGLSLHRLGLIYIECIGIYSCRLVIHKVKCGIFTWYLNNTWTFKQNLLENMKLLRINPGLNE